MVILDDVGRDATATWGLHPDAPPTPTLDALAAEGVRFTAAWAAPACAPSRATLLTGRHGGRTGVGGNTPPLRPGPGLPLAEITLAEVLADAEPAYTSLALGKWHQGTSDTGGLDHPTLQGFRRFLGTVGNLSAGHATDGRPQTYFDWEKNTDGAVARVTGWAPSVTIDDTIALVAATPEPWFAWVSLHAAHAPFEAPPAHLLPAPLPSRPSQVDLFRAMVTAVDREVGRLLEHVDLDRTLVVVLGDNGTPREVTTAPFAPSHAKKSVYEGGLGVPLVIAGPGVVRPGRDVTTAVHTTDLLPTIAEAAGVPLPAVTLDGESLWPWLRGDDDDPDRLVYAEWFEPNVTGRAFWEGAVRDGRHKLIARSDGSSELYDLRRDPHEVHDLLLDDVPAAADAAARLEAFLEGRRRDIWGR